MTDTQQIIAATTTPIIISLNRAWQAIQRNHPDVPSVMIVTGRRRHKSENSTRGSHCAGTWHVEGHDDKAAEVWISGERLAEGGEAVMQTLIHEAAHALAEKRGLKDTSNKNRYHNKVFVKLAEELGLQGPEESGGPALGYSNCTITKETSETYYVEISDLSEACKSFVSPGPGELPKVKVPTEYAYCQCPEGENKITWTKVIAKKAAFLGISPLMCAVCRQSFEPEGGL